MTNAWMMQVAAIIPVFSFRRYRNIIDVGGGEGLMMAAIIQKFPDCKGIVFDLSQSSDQALKIIEKQGIADRCWFIAGSFFETIPEGGDLYIY